MIQTDFFENLLKRVEARPRKKVKVPEDIQKHSDRFNFKGYPVSVLRRPYQRSLGVIVKPNGLIRITAAKSASSRSIWQFLYECEKWIDKTQYEYRVQRDRYPRKKMQAGEKFSYLGHLHELQFFEGPKKNHNVIFSDQRINFFVGKDYWHTHFSLPLGVERPEEYRDLKPMLRKFYEKEGRRILSERVAHWVEAMALQPTKVSYRAQKTRWGSSGSNGHISLNWKLIAAPLDVIDYVIIHELAHLKHQNHSKRFWKLVEDFSPKYKSHRRWLTDNQYEFDFLAKKSELHDE